MFAVRSKNEDDKTEKKAGDEPRKNGALVFQTSEKQNRFFGNLQTPTFNIRTWRRKRFPKRVFFFLQFELRTTVSGVRKLESIGQKRWGSETKKKRADVVIVIMPIVFE